MENVKDPPGPDVARHEGRHEGLPDAAEVEKVGSGPPTTPISTIYAILTGPPADQVQGDFRREAPRTPRPRTRHLREELAGTALTSLLFPEADTSTNNPSRTNQIVTVDVLNAEVQAEVCLPFSPNLTLLQHACSVRVPTADLPNMAASLGGLVAQEAI